MPWRVGAATVLGALGASVLTAVPATAADPATDLFFSEYVEGSSNDKAIEIYNGTGADVDLSSYSVELYSNGRLESAGASNTQELTGTLVAGDVLVLTNASASPALAAYSDLASSVTNFNGDDALVLKKSGTVIDRFGQVGVDPGTEWPGGGLDDTLTRNADVCAGDTAYLEAFDASIAWTSAAKDTFDGLGSHTSNCGSDPVDNAPTVSSIVPADGALGVPTTVAPVVTFSEDVAVTDAFTLTGPDGAVDVTVTGGPREYTVTPAAELTMTAQYTLTVLAAGVVDLDGDADALASDVTATFTVTEGVIPIGQIQGSTDTSPYVDQTVSFEGVVVGDYEGASAAGALRGFYVQSRDGEGDADPATSEGIFVFNAGADEVALGDEVAVTGTVAEYQGQTQVSLADVEVLASGASVTPAAVSLPFASAAAAEASEGMLVTFAQDLTVTEIYLLGRFNEVTVSGGGRLDQPSAVVAPGPEAVALQEANNLNKVKIDDAINLQNVDPMGRGGEPLSAQNTLRGGDTVTGLTGVLTYTWAGNSASGNAWRVRPVSMDAPTPDFQASNPRPTEAPAVGGDVKVTAFNVLNYFLSIDNGQAICGPDGFKQTCRGADSQVELDRQTDKLVEALVALDADVIGMAELENTTGVEPLAALAAEMNTALGTDSWSYVDTGIVGTDTIRVGFLYDSAVVSEVGSFAVLDNSVDPTFDDDNNRPSVAQTFEDGDGETFTVVANHWKSKGSCPASGVNADAGDGASCWNGARTAAAEALVGWLDTYPTGTVDDDYIIMGDLNSYGQEDPIQVLRAAGYVELAEDYSYVFDGQWGSLDYAFASASMADQVTDAEHFHINADEPGVLDYNTDFQSAAQIENLYAPDMYRTSDHDPVLIGLDLGGSTPPTTTVQVLGTNDFHGRILPNLGSGEAGAAVMAGAVTALESEYTNSVFTAAGDLVGASTFESFISKDKPTIDALNAMGLDVSAVGNHEFDQGYDDLVNRIMADYDEVENPFGGATWEYLGANVRNAADDSAALPETWIATFDNGTQDAGDDVRIGFVGVVTEETDSLVSPGGIEGLEFEDEAVAANRAAEALEAEGVNSIVLLVHEGAPTTAYADAVDPSNNFGKMLSELSPSIDAVISGHTHLSYNHQVPVQAWIDAERAVTERPVVSAGQYGMNLDRLIFEFDNATGELIDIDSSTVSLTKKADPACTSSCALVGAFTADPEVQAIVTQAQADANVLGAAVLGQMDAPLYRARMATGNYGDTRGAESTLGNAVAEVQRWATEGLGAQIAFMNPGGLRADMLGAAAGTGSYPSPITYKQAAGVQPFANTLVTMTLTGEQIASVLEEQWQPAGSSRPFLRLGVSEGFEYTYDATAPAGERILQMWLDGELIESTDTFTVTMNSFLSTGGDNFTTFREGTDKADSGRIDLNAMVDYLDEFGSLGTDYDQRAIGVQAESLTAVAGQELSFDLTSLMFTAAPDLTDANVVVSLGGEELGTFPVTNALPTDTFDEHGTASVTVTIPEGLEGTQLLEIEGDTTGTAFALAIEVVPGVTTVQVLGTNDFHGRILPNLGSGEAGAAVMAGAVTALESEYTNSVFTAAGDLVGASTFESFISKDKPTIDALNAMGLDVSAVGNHEFDQGYTDLVERVMADFDAETNPLGGATWEYLGANVRNEDGSPALSETWLATFDNGTAFTGDDVSLGFVGVVTDETPSLVSPDGIEDLVFEDEAVAANRSAAMLEAEGADAIILLVHEGAPTTAYADAVDTGNDFGAMLAALDDSIDAVISGHTHLSYNHQVPVQAWIDAERAVTERPVVSAGQYGMNLDRLIFEFDNATGELIDIDSSTVSLTKKADPACTSSCALVGAFTADPAVQAIVDAAVDQADELGAVVLGQMDQPLYRAKTATGSSGSSRGGESTLGNAVAEVQRWATEGLGAQIAFMNPGGLRADMVGAEADGTGDITFKGAATVQPFANTLVTMDLTGEQIASVLEEQWQPAGSSRPFLRLGVSEGFEYTYDPGSRTILQMWLNGEPIDLDATYKVTVNSFLAAGGDNFSTFAEGDNKADSGRIDLNAMVDYLDEFGSIGTDYDQRAIGVDAPSLRIAAGADLSFELSSLMFTGAGDLTDDNVTVSLGETALGTFPVTNIAPTGVFDEHGTASVTVTIPDGLEGEHTLTIEGDVTGTAFDLVITVVKPITLTDIAANPFRSEIVWLAATGITTGWATGEGTADFRPLTDVNRDMMAAFLYRLAGEPHFEAPAVSPFVDVPTTHVFYKEIAWLAEEGISEGWTVGGQKYFRPGIAVNRDVMAAFLYRFAGEPEFTAPATSPFLDVPTTHVFYTEIAWLAQTGISQGWTVTGGAEFRPTTAVKRDVMAAFLYRYAHLL